MGRQGASVSLMIGVWKPKTGGAAQRRLVDGTTLWPNPHRLTAAPTLHNLKAITTIKESRPNHPENRLVTRLTHYDPLCCIPEGWHGQDHHLHLPRRGTRPPGQTGPPHRYRLPSQLLESPA